jgi:putative transposase
LLAEYIISADAPYPNYNQQAKNLTQARKVNSTWGKIDF